MKWTKQLAVKFGGLGVAKGAFHWMKTLDYRAAYYDRSVDPVDPEFKAPAIFLFWHEYIPFLFYLRGFNNMAMLVSRHRDADWLSEAARHMGFSTVRGSTFRGGGAALRELVRKCKNLNLAITPDGPRGPRRELAQGAIFLSSKLQIPLVAVGLGYDQPWRMKTWDKFAIPKLGSKARAIASPLIQIPSDLDRDGIEHYRQQVNQVLNGLSDAAEDWAMGNYSLENESPLQRQARSVHLKGESIETRELPEQMITLLRDCA